LRATRAHSIQLGDSLASIADREYGSPELWRAIATANELEDPFNLRVGRELLIPAPADAAGMA
jgi:nucleoid-associated protein YgaU